MDASRETPSRDSITVDVSRETPSRDSTAVDTSRETPSRDSTGVDPRGGAREDGTGGRAGGRTDASRKGSVETRRRVVGLVLRESPGHGVIGGRGDRGIDQKGWLGVDCQ